MDGRNGRGGTRRRAGRRELGTRALTLAPDDEEMVRRAALLLERIGAGAAAQAALTTFAARLADEYDAEPAAETRELLARLEGLRPQVVFDGGSS